MATITGTAGNDSILPGGVSAGVTGGLPGGASDLIFGTSGSDTIDGGAGGDSLDYGGFTQPLTITLTGYATGTVVKTGGTTDGFTNVERLRGGSGNDVLTGSAATVPGGLALWLRGNAGNDSIDGASATSLAVDYFNSPAAINANLVTGLVLDGWGGTDTLTNVRRLNLTGFNDTVVGGSFGEVFYMDHETGNHSIDGGGNSNRGNEVRYAVNTALLVDLGSVAAVGGGFVGSVIKSNGTIDTITRVTRAVGGSAADTFLGTSGDDVVEGEGGNDVINGRSGVDFVGYSNFTESNAISTGAVVDLSLGTAADPFGGTDVLIDIEGVFGSFVADDFKGRDLGFANRSLLQGGGGNDTLRGASTGFTAADYNSDGAAVTVNLTTGTATDGTGATDTLIGINAARGTAFNDNLTGSAGSDSMQGGAGNDTLIGGAGLDRLLGEDGNDSISGGADVDTMTGGPGQDTLTGGTGGDRFNFTITATPGAHSSRATQDLITDFSVAEGDYIRLTATGAASPDIYYAGAVGTAYAALNVDIILPAFASPAGITPLTAWYVPHADGQTALGGWIVVDENGNGTLEAGEFAVRLGSAGASSGLRVSGSSIASPGLIGDGTSNTFFIGETAGGARGLGGDDVIYGGGSFDNMAGGLGNDQFVVVNIETTLIELAGEGEDTAWFGVSDATNGANIEIGRMFDGASLLRGSATAEQLVANAAVASRLFGNGGDDTLWSSSLADTLDGGDGDDIIRGQGGADVMYGGLGNDQFVVFDAGAQVIEYLNAGIDTVWVASASFTLGANIEIGRLAAAGAVTLIGSDTAEDLVANQAEASTLTGNGGNDVLWGSAFADSFNGGAGDDIMRGQGGNDVMVGGTGNDQYVVFASGASVTELANQGYDIVYFTGAGTFNLGQNIEESRLVDQGTGLIGGDGAELMAGNSSGLASTILGRGGNDTIYGTAAADTISGGAGNDLIYGLGGADRFVYDAPGWGRDQVVVVAGGGAKFQFTAASGVTAFDQLQVFPGDNGAGNTFISHANGFIEVYGNNGLLTANDFIFG